MSKRQTLSKIKHIVFWSIVGWGVLFAAVLIPFLSMGKFEWNFKAEVNATMVNGIITSDAIVFGFVTLELRRFLRTSIAKFLMTLPLLFCLAATVINYFIDAVSLGYPTVNTMIWATVTFFYNIFYYALMLVFTRFYPQIQDPTENN